MHRFNDFSPPHICSIEREDSRDRGRVNGPSSNGGGGGGKSSGSSGANTSYGAPVHTSIGPISAGIQAAKSPAAWSALNDQVDTYNKAATKWNAGTGRSLANTINAFAPMGMSMQPPEFDKPKTYVGGDYHLGMNPAALAGGLLGGAAVIGGGLVAGPAAGKLYEMAGGSNLMLGGGKVPEAWSINGPHPSQQTPSNHMTAFGNPTQGGGGMPAFPSAPGGAAFGAQPGQGGSPVTPPAPQAPGFFNPKIPNHSLPQGYQSLFPNSLSEADKALLYGKALMG